MYLMLGLLCIRCWGCYVFDVGVVMYLMLGLFCI